MECDIFAINWPDYTTMFECNLQKEKLQENLFLLQKREAVRGVLKEKIMHLSSHEVIFFKLIAPGY